MSINHEAHNRLSFNEWKHSANRKPLLLRGARQIGKTYSVRNLGKQFESYVEINFELLPEAIKIFELDLQPSRIIRDLSILLEQQIHPGKTLLFLDEIQRAPKAIAALRTGTYPVHNRIYSYPLYAVGISTGMNRAALGSLAD